MIWSVRAITRATIYRLGFRPHRLSRLHSPLLARRYAWHDTELRNRATRMAGRGVIETSARSGGQPCRPTCRVCIQ